MDKEVYTVKDLMEMLNMCYGSACKVMREVKTVSNILGFKGIIHKKDWNAYIESKGGRNA